MNVVLTFDIEVWCGSWEGLDERFPAAFERYVYGRSPQGEYALPKTLEILNRHGLKGIFFVEPLFAARFGMEHLAVIVDLIRDAGQQVELHIHPEWVDEIEPAPIAEVTRKRPYLSQYTLDEQRHLIGLARGLLEQVSGTRCRSFRAGSFACNRDTFRALDTLGIGIDSSLNACIPWSGVDLRDGADFTAPSVIEGVESRPVGLFTDGFGRLRPTQVSGASIDEFLQVLERASELGVPEMVIVSHNFEMLRPDASTPDPIVVRRYEELCRFLGRQRDVLPTTDFLPLPGGAAGALPRAGWPGSMRRLGEQAWRRVRDR